MINLENRRKRMKLLNVLSVVVLFVWLLSGNIFGQKAPAVKRCLLKVEGMTCDKCVNTVKEALESVKGVKEAKVSLDKKEAEVKFENGVDLQALVKAVTEKGYKAELNGEIIVLNIAGMHCQHCAKEVEQVLEQESGVISADVNYEKKEAVVACQPGKVTLDQLIQIIEKKTKYKATAKQ